MGCDYTTNHDFRLVAYPHRVYSGDNALDALPGELVRQNASRALVICGRSVAEGSDLIDRIGRLLGPKLAGVYAKMRKDTPLEDAREACAMARGHGADILIAVGAGSVIQSARVVAILLAETRPIEELATRYPEDGGPAQSPKLMAPKLPIINVLTAATTAQNRGGSPAKVEGLGRRMEFFDPKTRPVAIFWDSAALATAPVSMMKATGAAVFWRAAMNLGYLADNPLVQGNRRQAFDLSHGALAQLDNPDAIAARIDLCAATYLQNQEADLGSVPVAHWVARVVYAFAAAIFNLHPHVSQGAAHAAMTPTVMRRLGRRDPAEMTRIAAGLGVWNPGDPIDDAPERAAARLEEIFSALDLPARGRDTGVPASVQEEILANSLRNFNADPRQEFRREVGMLRETLSAAW